MKKLILGLAVTSALGLAGCSDSPKEPVIPGKTKAIYQPSNGLVPLPNDLIFNGTEDLTLNPPVDDASDYSDPIVAVSGLDGWSAVAPFFISFAGPEAGVDLAPASIVPGSTIKMYEVNVLRPEALPGTGIPVPSGPVTSVVRELTPGVDFVATYATDLTVAVIPLLPLTPQASYAVVVTNGVTDSNGNAIVADGQYEIVKGEDALDPNSPTAGLEPVRQLVNAIENAVDADGQAKEDIVLSFQFTVQSMGEVVAANKLLNIDLPFSMGSYPATSFTQLPIDTAPITGIGAADLYKGQLTLNYYLQPAADQYDVSAISTFFVGADQIPNPADPMTLIPNPFAGGTTTYANPLVKINGQESVPLLVSMPKAGLGCTKPAAGYPVMIFQHGITSNRTNMLGIADTMAAPPLCTAVVAMDMPLHGIDANHDLAAMLFEGYTAGGLRERTFGLDLMNNTTGAAGPDGIPETSGSYTINLRNLLVARDNNRQAVLDLLTLEKAIPAMDFDGNPLAPDLDYSNVSFMGHSWGGIVGNIFLAHSDFVKLAVLANSGGNLAGMIDGSPQFGDPVKAALAAQGIETGSADYQSFLFATQTVIDDGDSINSNAVNLANGIPLLMFQVAGDTAVPNAVATSPTAGTVPMAAMLGTTVVSAENAGDFVAGSRLFSRMNSGIHGTVLTPAGPDSATQYLDYTVEMQTQIATFIGSGGLGVTVTDPSLLE
ncbi:hypothetical protein [Aliikangiella sp. G2MR2-5]|uniref:hypothetical protein n=1 Tax=Aliikangiella sp. G2MR2-5 TaxID=2788943 RepID=UPI0018ABB198|nr:hypothetical protein [Aliikangiella sp. G2MR2-5]